MKPEDVDVLDAIMGHICVNYQTAIQSGLEIKDWLKRQVDGVILFTTDPPRGLAMLQEGLQQEADYLRELL
jgi:hypothetical protein